MKLKLSHKIILNFVIVLIIPMLLSVHLVTIDLNSRSSNEIYTQLEFTTRVVNKFFLRSFRAAQVQFRLMSSTGDFRRAFDSGGTSEIEAQLKFIGDKMNCSFIDVYTFSEGGAKVLPLGSYHREAFYDALIPSLELVKIAARGKNLSSLVLIDEQKRYFRCVMPVNSGSRTSKEMVLCAYQKIANDSIDAIKEITNIDVAVYNDKKSVITTRFGSTGRRLSGEPLDERAYEALKTAESYRVEEKYLSDYTMNVYSKIYDEEKKFAGYICVMVPKEFLAGANMYVLNHLYVILVISLVLATISGYLLSSNIAVPLKKFARIAQITSEGDFKQRISMQRSDEIGELSCAFDKMSDRLDKYNESLKRKMFETTTLYEVSRSMNFMNNKEQLLTIILTKMIEALNAEKGSIMLYNAEECLLFCEMAVGYSGKFERRVKFAPGEGKAGQAFLQGDTIVSNDIQSDQTFVRTQSTHNTDNLTYNMMCVPMKAKDEAVGVINIVNKKGGDGFNEDDRALAASLATQAAMTIENARLYELSITDGMTKMFIHRYFQIRLDEEIKRSVRFGASLSLLMLDIDHFKKFNDTYGHQVGDMVLIKVADIIRDTIRGEIDIACRYGGEEFAIIAPQTGFEDAKKMAERIRSAVERANLSGPSGRELKITISLGISTYPINTKEKKELITKADSALYFSKQNGRNCSTHYSDAPDDMRGVGLK